jgi:hypothetical protein
MTESRLAQRSGGGSPSTGWTQLLWAAVGVGIGAATTYVCMKATRARRVPAECADDDQPNIASPTLPPSLVDAATLSRVELGSPAARALFFLAPDVTFLNHGSYGAVPRVVMSYFERVLQRIEAYPDLWFRAHSWTIMRQAIQPFVRQTTHTAHTA